MRPCRRQTGSLSREPFQQTDADFSMWKRLVCKVMKGRYYMPQLRILNDVFQESWRWIIHISWRYKSKMSGFQRRDCSHTFTLTSSLLTLVLNVLTMWSCYRIAAAWASTFRGCLSNLRHTSWYSQIPSANILRHLVHLLNQVLTLCNNLFQISCCQHEVAPY